MGFTVGGRRRLGSGTSPILCSVHHGVATGSTGIESLLSGVIGKAATGFLRSGVVARHSNEFMMPLGTRRGKRVSNVMRSASTANSALFVRPVSIIRAGGRMQILGVGRRRRVSHVLTRLSTRTNGFIKNVATSFGTLIRLSLVFTGSGLTCGVGTTVPGVGGGKCACLGGTERPLVGCGAIIPVAIRLNGTCGALMVANPGANNGAIAVGAVNLLALVAVYKLVVPISSNDRVTVCDGVFTSVNSRRDVRRSLSAFSSRVMGVVSVLSGTSDSSLILFSRLYTNASPVRNTTLTGTVLVELSMFNDEIITAARCPRLGSCTVSAREMRGTDYRFSIAALGPACHLVVNVPKHSGTFTVSNGLNLSRDVVSATGRRMGSRSLHFRHIIRSLRGTEGSTRGRRGGTRGLHVRLSRTGQGDSVHRTRLSMGLRGTVGRAHRGTGRVLRGTHCGSSLLLGRLRRVGGRVGTRGTSGLTSGTQLACGGALGRLRSRTSPVAIGGVSNRNMGAMGGNSVMVVTSVNESTAIVSMGPSGGRTCIVTKTVGV